MLYFFKRVEHMPELGQFLKEKREFSGLSLKKLSSVTGISDSELLKIENGKVFAQVDARYPSTITSSILT